MSGREDVFAALFALGQGISWGIPARSFLASGRRVRTWGETPSQPALYQAEHAETITQVTNLESKRMLEASWIIYHNAGANPAAIPATETNLILDAIDAALAPDPGDTRLTLGGLAYHVWIEGQVFRDNGDIDNQAMLVVPIRILWP